MIKAVLLDADGVVLKSAEKMFSRRLKDEYQIEIPLIFWKEVYPQVRLGKASLKEELRKRIKNWGWPRSVEALLNYWWTPQNKPNLRVLELVKRLKTRGIKCYLASDNNQYRARLLMKGALGQIFNKGFFSCYLGCVKEDKEFYQAVFKETKLKPEEILFVDDEKENVQAAQKMGLRTHFYQDFKAFEKESIPILKGDI
ncbi:HAD-IA family hydrolase [Patescibacteria group bacterium]